MDDELSFNKIVNGKLVYCEGLCTFHDEINNKDYIIYTDNTLNENGKLNVYYSFYKIINNKISLYPVIDNEDKKVALKVLAYFVKNSD